MGFSKSFFPSFLSLIFTFLCTNQVQAIITFNVLNFGASGDGKTDNTKAFSDTWNQACQSKGRIVILIPAGTYLVHPIIFIGPCKGSISFHVLGVVKAPTDAASIFIDHWISFRYIDGLRITGGGSFDGQGASAWAHNTCQKDPHCPPLPVTMRFDFVKNGRIDRITSINSKNFHFSIFASTTIRFQRVQILAPGDSPNTDGIHMADSTDVQNLDSIISTGDDCISLGPGSQNINITNVHCGPGHGFSIGSMGGSPNEKGVTGVTVMNCNLTGTQNGLRIKTWSPSNPGTCSDITYENINFKDVNNPIFIDQNYCPSQKCGPQGESRVKIEVVTFKNVWGTSSSKVAVNLQCSRIIPCQDIELSDINIDYNGGGGAVSSRANVKGFAQGKQNPPSCISN